MWRFAVGLALILAAAIVVPARGQEPGPRYVPIPFEGNFETLFKARLQASKEREPFNDLLNHIRRDPQKFDIDPTLLNQLNLEDPALRHLLRGMIEKRQ